MAKNYKLTERVCLCCNKQFSIPEKDLRHAEKNGKTRGIYCSKQCCMTHYSNQCRVTAKCSICNKKFSKLRSKIPSSGITYCSTDCSDMRDRSYRTDLSLFKWLARSFRQSDRTHNKGSPHLTAEHLKEVFEAQNGICPITGWKLTLPTCRDSDYYTANPLLPNSLSLDRIDNSIGHINGNIRFVSVMANYARNRFNDEDLKGFIKAAYSHLGL